MQKTIQSLEKALKILEYLSTHPQARIQDICLAMEMNKTTVHTLLSTLELYHYVEKEKDRPRYSLGVKLFQLGKVYDQNFSFHYPVHVLLKKLSDMVDETSFFALQIGCKYLYLDKYDCKKQLKISPTIGTFEEICSQTAVGKVFKSYIQNQQISYSVDYEEIEKGMNCVAFGLCKNGVLLGVVGLAGNATTFTQEKIEMLIKFWLESDICDMRFN
ncbi:MAG: IclR family transcriptional regulator [Brevinema sp.]